MWILLSPNPISAPIHACSASAQTMVYPTQNTTFYNKYINTKNPFYIVTHIHPHTSTFYLTNCFNRSLLRSE